jgi:hypothetical protein
MTMIEVVSSLGRALLVGALLGGSGGQARDPNPNSNPNPDPNSAESGRPKPFQVVAVLNGPPGQVDIDVDNDGTPLFQANPKAGGQTGDPNSALFTQQALPQLTAQPAINLDGQFVFEVRDPSDETLGATLEPVGDSLRAQLGLPNGQGLVVASLVGDGPAAQAGLKEKDILLALSERPLGKVDDLTLQLKEAGEKDVPLQLLRAGKPMTLRVRPVYRVTLGAAGQEKTDYFIGVSVDPPDDTLRAHLDLKEDQGLVANEVVADSPAAKAGVKPHDILLELGGKPLTNAEVLVAQVQAAKDQPAPLKLLRAGKPLTLQVTPERRTVQARTPHTYRLWSLGQQAHPGMFRTYGGIGTGRNFGAQGGMGRNPYLLNQPWHQVPQPEADESQRLGRRIDDLDKDLKALRKAVEELRDAVKASGDRGRARD